AFGLLAYQSTWLRVHYGPEFLCALLDEQPMGFYPPDALVHEAQRRGIEVLPPDVNASEVGRTVVDAPAEVVALRPGGGRVGRLRRAGRRAARGAVAPGGGRAAPAPGREHAAGARAGAARRAGAAPARRLGGDDRRLRHDRRDRRPPPAAPAAARAAGPGAR